MIEYHLSEEQYDKLYDYQEWDHLFDNCKLEYKEHHRLNEPGYWGTLIGDEKDINWFLLQL